MTCSGRERATGRAAVTSDDRGFLDRVATQILALEGDSKVVFFGGHFSRYDECRLRTAG